MEINFVNIEKAFQEMEKAGWNINKEKKWQYFFYNNLLGNLEKVNKELINKGFLTEYIGKTEDETEFVLILSKIELLTPVELNNKNIYFNSLELDFEVDYDGWDVENI